MFSAAPAIILRSWVEYDNMTVYVVVRLRRESLDVVKINGNDAPPILSGTKSLQIPLPQRISRTHLLCGTAWLVHRLKIAVA
jgi:hypothetical protein